MSYYIKFIENWNNSELTSYTFVPCKLKFETIVSGVNRISSNVDMSHSIVDGDVIITGTVSNNSTFAIESFGTNENTDLPYWMITFDAIVAETANSAWMNLTAAAAFYPKMVLKNSSIIDDNIRLISKDRVRYDAEKYISDDFFMSQPREATLKFLKDDARWLEEKFADENLEEEIKYTIYMEEDGTLIDYGEIDPDKNVGDNIVDVNGDTKIVYEKQVLLQQISKVVVEIWNDNEKVYTGFVDKSQTDQDTSTITIQCTDIIGIINKFAEQLIKDMVITTNDNDDYQYIISKDILDELITKIKEFTDLNFSDNNSESLYLRGGDDFINNNNNLDITNYLTTWPYSNPPNDLLVYQDVDIFTSNLLKSFVIYKCYTWSRTPTSGQGAGLTTWKLSVIYQEWTQENGIGTVQLSTQDLAEESYQTGEIVTYKSEDQAIQDFKTYRQFVNSYYDEATSKINFLLQNSSNNYDILQVTQDYYGVAIPVYSDVYEYKKLLKTIFYVNAVAMYSTNDGNVELINKDNISNSTEISISPRNIIKKGTRIQNIEKDNDPSTEALDIIWVDYEDDSIVWKRFYSFMKSKYAYMFTRKYPQTLTCSIYTKSVIDQSTIALVLGDTIVTEHKKVVDGTILTMYKKWVINEVPKNNTGFYYNVKALRIKDEENVGGITRITTDDGRVITTDDDIEIGVD